jgi:ABC-type nitrate/sulfonate/bicarbonate transport system substrate-binding protein
MVARFSGASLALLAFAVVVAAGLLTQNPITVTLSRAIGALFLFFIIGWVLGYAAQLVIAEHERKRESEIRAWSNEIDHPAKEGSV